MTAAGSGADLAPGDPHFAELQRIAESFHGAFKTVEDMAATFVRDAVTRGVYRPGERLQQDTIAAILGISRMPVRAGLRQLQTEGLLTIHPHRGATVTVLAPDEIREIYELRILIETYLLERAIPKVTPEILGELQDLARRLEETASTLDGIECRRAFYRRLYGLAERPKAMLLAARLRDEVGGYLLLQRIPEHSSAHFRLLEFAEKRDVAGARDAMREHLSRVSRELQEMVAGDTLT